jgi:transposase
VSKITPYRTDSRQYQLFEAALEIRSPWFIKELRFDHARRRLDINLDFGQGTHFHCSVCGKECMTHDTHMREWRHLDFFQYETHIFAPLPRTRCPDCGVKTVDVPWARRESGFTLLFEAWATELAQQMTILAAARRLRISDDRLWRLLKRVVNAALEKQSLSEVQNIALDETSWQKGHKYITLVFDYDRRRLIYATEGKGADTLRSFASYLEAHGGSCEKIKRACCDMSPAFISGIEHTFPNAAITFDKFHVIKAMNEALDEVRRREVKEQPILEGSRWDYMKNPENLSSAGKKRLKNIAQSGKRLQTAKAYTIKLLLQEILSAGKEMSREEGKAQLKGWVRWVLLCRIPEVVAVGRMLKRHLEGILNWFESRMTNALLEGYNSVLRAGRGIARGFRTCANVILKSFLTAGKLNFNFPPNIGNP